MQFFSISILSFFVLCVNSKAADVPKYTLGGLFPLTGGLSSGGIEREYASQMVRSDARNVIALTISQAVQKINANPSFNFTLHLQVADTATDPSVATRSAVDLLLMQGNASFSPVVALVGAAASSSSRAVHAIARSFGVPMLSYSSTAADLSNKALFPSFFRAVPPDSFQARALVDLLDFLHLELVTLVYRRGDVYGEGMRSAFLDAIAQQKSPIHVISELPFVTLDDDPTSLEDLPEMLEAFVHPAVHKVFVLFTAGTSSLKALQDAAVAGFVTKEHLWFGVDGVLQNSLANELRKDERFRNLTLMGTLPSVGDGDKFETFLDDWEALNPLDTGGVGGTRVVNLYAPFAYDCIYAYAHAFHLAQKSNSDLSNSSIIAAFLKQVQFDGVTGAFSFDFQQDRIGSTFDLVHVHVNSSGQSTEKPIVKFGVWNPTGVVDAEQFKTQLLSSSALPYDSFSCPAPLVPFHVHSLHVFSANQSIIEPLTFAESCIACNSTASYVAPNGTRNAYCQWCGKDRLAASDRLSCFACQEDSVFTQDARTGAVFCATVQDDTLTIVLGVLGAVALCVLLGILLKVFISWLRSQNQKRQALLQAAEELKVANRRLSAEKSKLNSEIKRKVVLQKQLARAKKKAETRLEMKTQMLANMSHELRTPLTTVSLSLGIVAGTELNRQQVELIETAQSALKPLMSLINDILDISRLEVNSLTLQPTIVSLDNVVEDAGELLHRAATTAGIEMICLVPQKAVDTNVVVDDVRLRQILVNLGSNAIKFTSKGYVMIECEIFNESEDFLHVHLHVRDTGKGMTHAQAAKVFKRYVQADSSDTRNHGGVGLGLSICNELVSMMGGVLTVRSMRNVGSVFTVSLPLRKMIAGEPSLSLAQSLAARDESDSEEASACDGSRQSHVFIASFSEVTSAQVKQYCEESCMGNCSVESFVTTDSTASAEFLRSCLENVDEIPRRNVVIVLDMELVVVPKKERDGSLSSRVPEEKPGVKKEIQLNDLYSALFDEFDSVKVLFMVDAGDRLMEVVDTGAEDVEMSLTRSVCRPVRRKKFVSLMRKLSRIRSKRSSIASSRGTTPSRRMSTIVTASTVKSQWRVISPLTGEALCLHVMIVEDNRMNGKLIANILQRAKFTFHLCANGQEAVDEYSAHHEEYDVIFMDIQMPLLNGLDATRQIRAFEAIHGIESTPIIALTAGAKQAERDDCMDSGMDGFLAKPMTPAAIFLELQRTVSVHIQKMQKKGSQDTDSLLFGRRVSKVRGPSSEPLSFSPEQTAMLLKADEEGNKTSEGKRFKSPVNSARSNAARDQLRASAPNAVGAGNKKGSGVTDRKRHASDDAGRGRSAALAEALAKAQSHRKFSLRVPLLTLHGDQSKLDKAPVFTSAGTRHDSLLDAINSVAARRESTMARKSVSNDDDVVESQDSSTLGEKRRVRIVDPKEEEAERRRASSVSRRQRWKNHAWSTGTTKITRKNSGDAGGGSNEAEKSSPPRPLRERAYSAIRARRRSTFTPKKDHLAPPGHRRFSSITASVNRRKSHAAAF